MCIGIPLCIHARHCQIGNLEARIRKLNRYKLPYFPIYQPTSLSDLQFLDGPYSQEGWAGLWLLLFSSFKATHVGDGNQKIRLIFEENR